MSDRRESLLQLITDELASCTLAGDAERREVAIDLLELIARRMEFAGVKEMLDAREWTRTYALQQLRERCAQVEDLQQKLDEITVALGAHGTPYSELAARASALREERDTLMWRLMSTAQYLESALSMLSTFDCVDREAFQSLADTKAFIQRQESEAASSQQRTGASRE